MFACAGAPVDEVGDLQRRGEGSDHFPRRAPNQQCALQLARAAHARSAKSRPLLTGELWAYELLDSAEDHVDLRFGCEDGALDLQLVGRPEIVGVEKGEQLAAGGRQSGVDRSADPP